MEPTNASRAAKTEAAVRKADYNNDDLRTDAQDLLSDIQHLANREGWDWHDLLRMANNNFVEEDQQ